ncbi:MAG: hypothetical protein JW900_00305 [Anaerolineae bacterium]|nr:hypothetical protein [Anaerolineae bacterium]
MVLGTRFRLGFGPIITGLLVMALGFIVVLGESTTAHVAGVEHYFDPLDQRYEYRIEYQFHTADGELVRSIDTRRGTHPDVGDTRTAYYLPMAPEVMNIRVGVDLPKDVVAVGLIVLGGGLFIYGLAQLAGPQEGSKRQE